jgi:hypothetical protein
MATYQLLIIDELGFVPLSKTGAELLFELTSQRYERGATLITNNLPFDEWTETLGSERLTRALLDRSPPLTRGVGKKLDCFQGCAKRRLPRYGEPHGISDQITSRH